MEKLLIRFIACHFLDSTLCLVHQSNLPNPILGRLTNIYQTSIRNGFLSSSHNVFTDTYVTKLGLV
jgi:hypothetical protein